MSAKTLRKIIKIDEEKCNGCGICIPSCAEGALKIVNGKVKLVDEKFCDGLGACLTECPEGALKIEERIADDFNEEAVKTHLNTQTQIPCGCPSTNIKQWDTPTKSEGLDIPSCLRQWPVQLALVGPNAPYFSSCNLLIAADCVPFAYGNFHQKFLKEKTVVIGCPKLDDTSFYENKLAEIFKNDIKSITVVNMEVPCCFGLQQITESALKKCGKEIPLKQVIISVDGNILSMD